MTTGRASRSERLDPARQPERWAFRFVPWIVHAGCWHVAVHVAPVGHGIVSMLACGRAAGALLILADNYFHQRVRGNRNRYGEPIPRRICRTCARQLKAAGESGRIERAVRTSD